MNNRISTVALLAASLLCLAVACHRAKVAGDYLACMSIALAAGAVAFVLSLNVINRRTLAAGESHSDLSEAQARERLIADYSADVHLSLRHDELTVLAVNPAVKRHWGYEPFLLCGKPILDIVAPYDKTLASDSLKSRAASFEIALLSQSGSVIETSWSTEYSQTEKRIYCMVNDISERKQAQRMKQRLFAMIGHDLRAPLASARMTLSTIPVDPKLSIVDTLLSRVIALSNDMLDLQQCEEGKLPVRQQLIELGGLFQEVADELSAALEAASQTLKCAEGEGLLAIGDEDRVKQILANFLSNAIKYADKGALIEFQMQDLGSFAEVALHDSGPGIPVHARTLLFEPYSRLDQTGADSRGLGLTLCRYLALAQGGSVGIRESALGGACFWLRLPKGQLSS